MKQIHITFDSKEAEEKLLADDKFVKALTSLFTLVDNISSRVGAEVMQADVCEKCDQCGGEKTYANQVCMPLNGKVRCIDWCIHQIVAALNAGGVETVACCCGHNQIKGRIDLADGRILWIEKPA